ncbi:unnamed protein product [Linum trigynum]|uniref:Uncharacterized protein n=1 Tax=Linum trigynum TaxID=586398 RepID=A0AAV2F895_9ROSI
MGREGKVGMAMGDARRPGVDGDGRWRCRSRIEEETKSESGSRCPFVGEGGEVRRSRRGGWLGFGWRRAEVMAENRRVRITGGALEEDE